MKQNTIVTNINNEHHGGNFTSPKIPEKIYS